jgi:chemotaxis signal transduction protein
MKQSEQNLSNIAINNHNQLITPSNRYIVVKVGDRLITFPDVLVAEIMIVERNAISALPFYTSVIVGVIHYQADVMPLLLLRLLISEERALITESLTVIRLSQFADKLNNQQISGIGLIVDRVIGSLAAREYPSEYQNTDRSPNISEEQLPSFESSNLLDSEIAYTKKITQTVANIKENEYTPIEIILSSIPNNIWQPQRWGKYSVG